MHLLDSEKGWPAAQLSFIFDDLGTRGGEARRGEAAAAAHSSALPLLGSRPGHSRAGARNPSGALKTSRTVAAHHASRPSGHAHAHAHAHAHTHAQAHAHAHHVGRASAHRVGLSGRGDGVPPDAGNRGDHQRALDDSSRSRRYSFTFDQTTTHSFLHSSIQRRPPSGSAVVQRTEDSVLRGTTFKRSCFSPVPACVPQQQGAQGGVGLYHRRPAEAVGLGVLQDCRSRPREQE
jgi:hypothetical protein